VILLSQLQPILESELLAPAFDNILPALFGALAVVFISKNWKIAMAPPYLYAGPVYLRCPSLGRFRQRASAGGRYYCHRGSEDIIQQRLPVDRGSSKAGVISLIDLAVYTWGGPWAAPL